MSHDSAKLSQRCSPSFCGCALFLPACIQRVSRPDLPLCAMIFGLVLQGQVAHQHQQSLCAIADLVHVWVLAQRCHKRCVCVWPELLEWRLRVGEGGGMHLPHINITVTPRFSPFSARRASASRSAAEMSLFLKRLSILRACSASRLSACSS